MGKSIKKIEEATVITKDSTYYENLSLVWADTVNRLNFAYNLWNVECNIMYAQKNKKEVMANLWNFVSNLNTDKVDSCLTQFQNLLIEMNCWSQKVDEISGKIVVGAYQPVNKAGGAGKAYKALNAQIMRYGITAMKQVELNGVTTIISCIREMNSIERKDFADACKWFEVGLYTVKPQDKQALIKRHKEAMIEARNAVNE